MKHSSWSRVLSTVVFASLATVAVPALPAAADWPTYHHDNFRSGSDQQNVAFNAVKQDWTSTAFDGTVYAQPLVVGNKVFVATENNSVYAFDATTGAQLWRYNAGAPVPASSFSCGNISPTNGITGTPVYDPSTNRLYAVATVLPATPTYELVTIDANTGLAFGGTVTLSYSGFSVRHQGQRGALALANNMIYIPFGGRDGDCTPYDGVVFGVPLAGGSVLHYTTPGAGTGGGIWSTGGVAAEGANGNLFVSTGNTGCPSNYDYNDSVLKLSPTLVKLDQFAPSGPLPNGDWHSLSCADADLGSSSPTLMPDLGLIFIQGKEPTGYLLRQSALGSTFSGSTFNAGGEVFRGPACSSMAFGAAAYSSPYIFVPCNNGLKALRVNTTNNTFSTAWTDGGSFSGPPIVAGGAVWNISGDTLHAYNPLNGSLLYSQAVGPFATSFPSPAAGNGRIYVANDTNLMAFAFNGTCTVPSTSTTTAGTGSTTFYFAEGFTAPGFNECLALLMPNTSGTATIDYWTQTSHTLGTIAMTAGQVATVNVNQVVGPNEQVSVRVTLPGPGIAERLLHFNFGQWRGSTDIVGVNAPNTRWDFAEGSTLGYFNEYLSLQNPNAASVVATLTYMTDGGAHPIKTVTLPANTRTTVAVFNGSLATPVANCSADTTCGVGRGIAGVSVSVTTPNGQPIVAERPFYVNSFGFGLGCCPIYDGHVAFGANAPATQWNFAEGTTLQSFQGSSSQGFDEYLTLQNPGAVNAANVNLHYIDQAGNVTDKPVTVNPQSRLTVEVFNTLHGVGRGVVGVSTVVTSDQPIVAERPMYMLYDFGQGLVAGATDVLGATGLNTLFGFSALTTAQWHNDYLTLQNPGASAASVSIDYYTPGGKVTKTLTVNAHTRSTVGVSDPSQVGPGIGIVGAVVTSINAVPILVEKPTYSSDWPNNYGATDTMGYSPAGF